MGKRGLKSVGELSLAKAHYAATEFSKIPGVRLRFSAPFFKEFTLQLPKSPERVVRRLTKDKILAGLPLKALDRQYKDCLLVAVTEKRTRTEIDDYCRALAAAVA
jgi:glycine dehydrogenase subunit 1